MSAPVTRAGIRGALLACGAAPGDTLLVHASLSALGHVIGGAEAIVLALLDACGPDGTIAAPAQSWTNLDPRSGVHGRPRSDWPAIRAALPGFDPATTPSDGMGRVAEAIRTWPGARRSDHPVRSWSAVGAGARKLTREQALGDMHGERSPLGAAMEMDALIVMIGTGYAFCTALHLAETRAAGRAERSETQTTWRRTPHGREEITYETPIFDHTDFEEIGAAFERAHGPPPVPLGAGHLRAARIRALVPFATRMMEESA